MSKISKIIWRLFITGIIIFSGLILAINLGWLGYMPSIRELENPSAAIASEVYAADGSLLGLYYIQNRSPVTYEEISPNVLNALVATEDARFYNHSGIDGVAVLRAVLLLGKKGGGSTITQQLAKNLFPRQKQNLATMPIIKLKEWIMAIKLERNLTKKEIITLYLNTVPFGDNTYGIKNASLTFFSKNPSELEVEEAAVLIGMLKGNTIYNPRRNPERSINRRNTVIDQMEKYNYITTAQAQEYKNKSLVLYYNRQNQSEGPAPYFRQVIEQEIKRWIKQYEKDHGVTYNIYQDGLKIYTTLDPLLQKYAEEAVEEHLSQLQTPFYNQSKIKNGTVWNAGAAKNVLTNLMQSSSRYLMHKEEGMSEEEIINIFNTPTEMSVFSWSAPDNSVDTTLTPMDSIKYMRSFLQTGFMAMDPYTGEIKAWVGGINHKFFKFDHVNIGTKRQVGSTIKPLLYCLAIDNGYSPCTTLHTDPQLFPGQKQYYDAGGSQYGSVNMSRALALSLNNASLYLLNMIGVSPFVQFMKKVGISSPIDPVPSIALGVTDISVFEMLWSYTMFPNNGINTQPIFITKIEDKHGNLLQSFAPIQKEIIDEHTAFKMVRMMQGVVDGGTAGRLRFRYGVTGDMAGKTGTTNNQSDAWFIGYSPQILAGAWVGCDDRFLRFSSTAQGQGASAALPIYALFMKKAMADPRTGINNQERFKAPDGFINCQEFTDEDFYYGTDPSNEAEDLIEQTEHDIPLDEWE